MSKFLTNIYPIINIHKKMSVKSEITTQMIYGESFSIIKKGKKWLKIKIKEDGYRGYIKNRNYSNYLKPTHKIFKLKTKIYKFPNTKTKKFELTFGSKLRIKRAKSQFLEFDKGWVNKNDVKKINFKERNSFKRIKIFKNVKYKWGGKSFKGIDCSGLIQIFINFNNKFCPRDTGDQKKYFKKSVKFKNIKKNDIIFWKGHVAVSLSKNKLIHAYGPMKKTVVMNTDKTIKRIDKTANLKVTGIKRI